MCEREEDQDIFTGPDRVGLSYLTPKTREYITSEFLDGFLVFNFFRSIFLIATDK